MAELGISPEPATRVRQRVLIWLSLAATIAYVCRNSIGVAEKTIRIELGMKDIEVAGFLLTPEDQMGWVMGAFFLSYAVFQLPAGWFSHVRGTRRALPLFALVWSLTTGMISLATGFIGLVLARFGLGLGQAGIFTCSTDTNARWFPRIRWALVSGVLASSMSIGAALGTALTGKLLGIFGESSWRWVFFAYSVPGVIWAIWFYLWFRDRPQDHAAVNAAELLLIQGSSSVGVGSSSESSREPIPWSAILTSPAMGWICGQQFFRAAGYTFYVSWFPTFLMETRGISTAEAGMQTSLPLLAVVLGSLTGGWLSDLILSRTGNRRLSRQVMAISSQVACALLVASAYFITNSWLATLVICAGSYCASVGGPCAYAITIDMGGKQIPTVFSMMNMAGNIGAFMFPIVLPLFVRGTGSWDMALFLFAGIHFGAALCWLCLNPNGSICDRSADIRS